MSIARARAAAAALLLVCLATPLLASDVTISAAASSNITLSNGVFAPTDDSLPATLNVTTLTTALASSNVTVRATAGGGNGDIIVGTAVSYASSFALRLEAFRNVVLNASITNTSSASVALRADSTGSGTGTVIVTGGSNVSLSGGSATAFYNPVSFGTPDVLWIGGTAPTAYMLVNSLAQLTALSTSSSFWSGNYALGRDIDASATASMNAGAGFVPIGTLATPFSGRFNGDGHTISSLFVNRPSTDYVALFGVISGATLSNISLSNVNITGQSYVGAAVGGAQGNPTITNVRAGGTVSVTGNAGGGLIGIIYNGLVDHSRSDAAVSSSGVSTLYIGGLIGIAQAISPQSLTVSNTYATGAVNGGSSTAVGGLIGYNNNTSVVVNSYSTGLVFSTGGNVGGLIGYNNGATVVSSYWDIQTSGMATSAAGTGKTTTQMKQQATFTGWNFSTIWNIIENTTYPFFRSTVAPVVTTTSGSTSFVEGGGAVAVDSSVTVSDSDNTTLASGTVSIVSGYSPSEDVLAVVTDGSTMGNITASWDGSTGALTLSSAGATATVAQWQAALRAVTYLNSSDNPSTAARTVRFVVNDATSDSNAADRNVTVTATNDAPVLTPYGPVLAPITEADTANAGQTVASIIGGSITDADAGALQGIAVIGATSTHGSWQYSSDGATWFAFGAVSPSSALLLQPSDYVRFSPDNTGGTTASFTWRAWDQTSASTDATTFGGSSAFSSATDTATIRVAAVPVDVTPIPAMSAWSLVMVGMMLIAIAMIRRA